jgi:hypothetical protein
MTKELEQRIKIASEIRLLRGVLKSYDIYSDQHGLFMFNRPYCFELPNELNEGFIEVIKQRICKLQKEFEEL